VSITVLENAESLISTCLTSASQDLGRRAKTPQEMKEIRKTVKRQTSNLDSASESRWLVARDEEHG
jgi:hypothetical protein